MWRSISHLRQFCYINEDSWTYLFISSGKLNFQFSTCWVLHQILHFFFKVYDLSVQLCVTFFFFFGGSTYFCYLDLIIIRVLFVLVFQLLLSNSFYFFFYFFFTTGGKDAHHDLSQTPQKWELCAQGTMFMIMKKILLK